MTCNNEKSIKTSFGFNEDGNSENGVSLKRKKY
jgi:hypothetical protein